MRFYLLVVGFMLAFAATNAQHRFYSNNYTEYMRFEGQLYEPGKNFHTATKPYRIAELNEVMPFDSVRSERHHNRKFSRTLIGRKLWWKSLLQLDSAWFHLAVDPVFNFELGQDLESGNRLITNTRGLIVKGSIGRIVSYETSFYENQASFHDYIQDWVDTNQVIPGQGRIKDFTFSSLYTNNGFKQKGYDFSMAQGYISVQPLKWLNIQFGNDRLFFGNGYRSFLLSDAGFNYPFLKITTKFRRLQYTNVYAQLQDVKIPVNFESGFKKKFFTAHYLSYRIGRRLQLGLFEGIVWQGKDSTGTRGFEINHLNPIILFRPIQFEAEQSPHNALVGLNFSFIPFKRGLIYGQVAVDEFNTRQLFAGEASIDHRIGFQFGFKWFDLFGLKNSYAQVEFNQANPYFQASRNSFTNYGHYAQPLSHPLGGNFREILGFVGYRWKDLWFEMKAVHSQVGRDTTGYSFGSNVNRAIPSSHEPGDPARIYRGGRVFQTFVDTKVGWIVNRASNLNLILGFNYRKAWSASSSEEIQFVYFGIRTNLRNLYYDY